MEQTPPTPASTTPATPADGAGQIQFDDFAKVDLRVATVVECRAHPNADKLSVCRVADGEGERQIVCGTKN